MQRARSGLEHHRHRAGRRQTVVCAVVRGQLAEFRDRVARGRNAHAARAAAVIVFAAIQQINVVVLSQAVELHAGVAAHRSVHVPVHLARCARSQGCQLVNAAAVDCDLRHLLAGDHVALLTGVRLDAYFVGFDGHCFLSAAELHLEVDTGTVADLKDQTLLFRDFESGCFRLHVVVTDSQFGKNVRSRVARHAGGNQSSLNACCRHFHIRNGSARRIRDGSDDRCVLCFYCEGEGNH